MQTFHFNLIIQIKIETFFYLHLKVSKKWLFACDGLFKITELIVNDDVFQTSFTHGRSLYSYWFKTEKIKKNEDSIDFKTLIIHNSSFNLHQNLKYLYLGNWGHNIDSRYDRHALAKILNLFTQLEHLEIISRLAACSRIELAHLKTLKLCTLQPELTLVTPKLSKLFVDTLKYLYFIYPDEIRFCEIFRYQEQLEQFKNLEILVFSEFVKWFDKDLFKLFHNLKQIKIHSFFF